MLHLTPLWTIEGADNHTIHAGCPQVGAVPACFSFPCLAPESTRYGVVLPAEPLMLWSLTAMSREEEDGVAEVGGVAVMSSFQALQIPGRSGRAWVPWEL